MWAMVGSEKPFGKEDFLRAFGKGATAVGKAQPFGKVDCVQRWHEGAFGTRVNKVAWKKGRIDDGRGGKFEAEALY